MLGGVGKSDSRPIRVRFASFSVENRTRIGREKSEKTRVDDVKNTEKTTDKDESDATKKNRTSRPILSDRIGREIEGFGGRLKEAIGGESVRSFARRAKLAEGTLRQYVSGNRYPDLDFLAVIAETAQVNLLWLATGEGPKRGESTGLARPGLDEAALVWALERVENAVAGLPSARKARLVAAFYTLYIRSGGAVDPAAAEELLRAILSNQ